MSQWTLIVDTPVGAIGVRTQQEQLIEVEYLGQGVGARKPASAFDREVERQLKAYFRQQDFVFHLPVQSSGTAFQRKVWALMLKIPAGKTRTYGDVARELGSSPRAVGNACRANPLPLVVPCHRIVSANGIGGFAGQRSGEKIDIKQWLLQHERALAAVCA